MPRQTLPKGAITCLATATGLERSLVSKAYNGKRELTADHLNQIWKCFPFVSIDLLASLRPPLLITYLCSIIDHSQYMQQILIYEVKPRGGVR